MSDYIFYILFYLNNHFSLFAYYYLHRERERERERNLMRQKVREKKIKIIIYKARITV